MSSNRSAPLLANASAGEKFQPSVVLRRARRSASGNKTVRNPFYSGAAMYAGRLLIGFEVMRHTTTAGLHRKHLTMSVDQDNSHSAPRFSHARPDRSEHITADSARGSLIGGKKQLLVMLIAALVLIIVGVGNVAFWVR